VLSGNIVPVTQGQRFSESFAIDKPPVSSAKMPIAITRTGANSTPDDPTWDYLYSLRTSPLAWLAQSDPNASPLPEIQLASKPPNAQPWNWVSSLINAGEFEPAFTIEPATWRAIATNADGSIQYEYDNDLGETIRFGNGIFGELPNTGDIFEVKYRVGAGAAGNVASDTINIVDPAWTGVLLSATNPFPSTGGQDRETNEQVRRLAPQAFRARQFRAVRAEDYEKAAEELSWVQQAGTAFRWTGSWLTVFTTPDPKAVETVSLDEHIELIHLLNRRRLAGYESYVPEPVFVSIDLLITVCAKPDAFQGDVEKGILDRLGNSEKSGRAAGFFFADSFSFGTPLERSRLEAAIQEVFGVAGVLSIKFRRRGFVPNFIEMPDVLPMATDQILRIDNDPDFPERGSIQVRVSGGK
jgi:predicted phage baseplate assembly protein